MASKKLALLLGTLPVLVPGHDPLREEPAPQRWVAQALPNRRNPALDDDHPNKRKQLTEAQSYYSQLTESFNPRFGIYEEKNPVILVIEKDKDDHKAEVIKIIESTYGAANPPEIVYINSNLLNEDAAFSIGELLNKKGISLSNVRAINFSMGSWFDSTSPTSALAMRSNILKFKDSIFVHGAGNMSGGQPVFGLTTQLDHAIVVGATEHARHERLIDTIRPTDFTASTETPTSAVDLVMKGRDVPMDGISGQWSKDGKDDKNPRKDSGTSFSAPQVTALAAKISARYRDFFVSGLPGQRYKEELTPESIAAKYQRRESFVDSVTSSLLLSAAMVGPLDKDAVIGAPGKRPFDTKGSGYGMPHPGIAERIMFDQMLAAQLEGRAVSIEDYQAYAPQNDKVYPRTPFKSAKEEQDAFGGDFLRHSVSVRVPVPLKTQVLADEKNTLAIDIPAFDKNMSAHLLRGSLLFKVEPEAKPGEKKKAARYELFIESPDRGTRIPLGMFGAEKKTLWHTDRPHPIDDFAFVNFRTRAHLLGETAPKDAKHGWRFIVKTTNKDPKDVEVFASGDRSLPVLEITGVEHEQEIFSHHPAGASKLGFLTQKTIVESYKEDMERLEDKLDDNKKAQRVIEDFINGNRIASAELLEVLPDLFKAAKDDASLLQAVGLIAHNAYVEPIVRSTAERLLHLAKADEDKKNPELEAVTKAYSALYKSVLAYEKSIVLGDYKELEQQLKHMSQGLKDNAPHLERYAKTLSTIYSDDDLIQRERQDVKALYLAITGENLILQPPANRKSIIER